jgi:hypothetical protein
MPLFVETFKPHGVETLTEPGNEREAVCAECKQVPAHGTKLKHCSVCFCVSYCSAACQRANWPSHKNVCQLAKAKGFGADKRQTMLLDNQEHCKWYWSILGLHSKVMRLAWIFRKQSPIITVITHDDPTEPVIEVLSRPDWEALAQRGLFDKAVTPGVFFDRECFNNDESFFCVCILHHKKFQHNPMGASSSLMEYPFVPSFITNALRYALTMEEALNIMADLEDYAATVKDVDAELMRKSRVLFDGVARFISSIRIGHRVCLTGLQNSRHLNGKEVLVVGRDPNNVFDRLIVRFDDGKAVSIGMGHW